MANVDDQLARIEEADHGKPRKTVTVLGAGMAGLSAAYELSRLGHHVTIIEATNRVGGRVWTHYFPSGQYHELGAMRIPASHDYTRHYICIAGLQKTLRPFITAYDTLNCFYYLRGQICRIREAPALLFDKYQLSAHESALANSLVAPAILGVHFENALKSLNDEDRGSLFGERFLTDRAAQLESQSLGEFLESRVESADAKELVGVATGLESFWDMAISMFLRDEIAATGKGLEEIAGGMSRLPEELAKLLGSTRIRFNTEVTSIELTENGVRLRTRHTDPKKWDCPPVDDELAEEETDFVICTIPFGVLRRMRLARLSYLKMLAIRNLNYASSTKVLLHCDSRFWEIGPPSDRIIGGASLSDQITRSTYYPSDHAPRPPVKFADRTRREGFKGLFSSFAMPDVGKQGEEDLTGQKDPGPGVLVGSYSWGSDARRLGALSENERATAVMDVIENFHPQLRKHVTDHKSMFWDTYRWTRGAFCFMHAGDLRSYYHAAIRPEGKLHFAGEHCSVDQAWIQGAAMSGLRTVEEIVNS